MLGTATQVSSYLLVEHNGPWPRDAIAEAPMSPRVRTWLQEYSGTVLLIRRPDRPVGEVHAFDVHPDRIRAAKASTLDDLVDLPPTAWEHYLGSLYLVCTHGKRDACCAQFGRGVADSLSDRHPVETWEASHLGGHRFAANVLVLPDGLLYGRVRPDDVAAAVAGERPELVRGRCWIAAADQVREALGANEEVTVEKVPFTPGRVSCRDTEPSEINILELRDRGIRR